MHSQWQLWLYKTVGTLLAICFLISLSCYLLLSQEWGNQLLLKLAQKAVPELHIEQSQGTLWRGLQLKQLSYQNEAIKLDIPQSFIQLRSRDIFIGKLWAEILQIDELRLQIKHQDNSESEREADLKLPSLSTPLVIVIKQLNVQALYIEQEEQTLFAAQQLQASASWFSRNVRLEQFSIQSEQLQASAHAQGSLRFHQQWPLELNVKITTQLPDELDNYIEQKRLDAALIVKGNLYELLIQAKMQHAINAQFETRLRLLDKVMQYQASAHWEALELSFSEQDFSLLKGKASLKGQGNKGKFTLAQDMSYQQLAFKLNLDGRYQDKLIEDFTLILKQGLQALQLQGLFDIESLTWQITGQASNINTASVYSELESQLDFPIASRGYYRHADDWQADLLLEDIQGTLQEQSIRANLSIKQKQQQWLINSQFQSPKQKLFLTSQFDKQQLYAKVSAQSDEIGVFYPPLTGQLDLDIKAHGSWKEPKTQGFATLKNATYQNIKLEQADLRFNANKQQQVDLELRQLQTASAQLDYLQLNVTGDLQQQAWQLSVSAHDGTLQGHWLARQHQQDYQLSFQQMDFTHPWLGQWQLSGDTYRRFPTDYNASFCLVQNELSGLACFDALYTDNDIALHFDLQQFDLAPFAPLIDSSIDLNAKLNTRFSARYHQQQLEAELRSDILHGYLQFSDEEQQFVRIPWQGFTMQANLLDKAYQAKAELHFDADNFLRLNITGQSDQQNKVNGGLQLNISNLQLIELFTPLRQVKGQLVGDLSVNGSMTQPLFNGRLNLHQGSAMLADAGLNLSDIELAVNTTANNNVELTGQIVSAGKALKLHGTATQQENIPWPTDIFINGENVQLLNLKEAQLWASPELHIQLRNRQINTSGQIHINKANVLLKELPKTALRPSADSVLVNQENDASPWDIDTQLQIFLGNDFAVEGMGLKARFTGDMLIKDQAEEVFDLSGIVKINDGRYKAYGQNLHIERGNLLFQGDPSNPGLDIIASRTLSRHQVKAGLEFSGTLKTPQSRVFSEPAMEESEAMSWLLFGKPLSSTSDNDANALIQAIAVYGIEHGDSITQKLSDQFGLDIGFDTDGENEEAAFSLGKQLSSRLYLRYSVALFESLSSIMLRYNINKSLNLETRSSGQSNSIDLLYRREKN